ncbi:MAG TPA: C25 family cysteine peptidase, partial [Caldilineaceae bacterium]|nr:C25 family cysteine peptidase [Caldilineaceae bacterium]
ATLPATSLTGQAGPYKTLILVDNGRLRARYPAAEVDALLAQLATLAARAEVSGVVVDVGADSRVAAANARADQFAACPYAKNVVAESIKAVVNAYRAINPLEYLVLVGNDDVIPFFRYPDNALLGHESNYVPPVGDVTPSQASLRLGYVLSQDAYGSAIDLSLNATTFPAPGLAVGRLVETPADIQSLLAAYLATAAGVAPTPQAALVTGYDFLEDVALAVQSELAAGLGGPVDSLITPNEVSPLDPASWTAQQLAAQLGSRRYDIAFLAGHFNAASVLAADYRTSFLTTDLLALPVDMTNMLVYSAGCHAGYNIVNAHGVPGVTFEPDWAQAFAGKGATLIAGTGYQYGDTEFIEYSERLYLEFTRRLRTGAGPVPVGKALVAAKQRYLATTPFLRGIHEKALLEATLFGLPMFALDLPGQRLSPPSDAPDVGQPAPVAAGPGALLGLHVADLSLTPQLAPRTLELTNVENGSAISASWLEGSDGVVTNPAEPALPLESLNVTAPGWVLRGVGFRGGIYQDVDDVFPLTGAPTTELRGVHSPFQSDVWSPIRPWSANYFDALSGGLTRLFVTPAQHRSPSPGAQATVRRHFEQMDFRLFYSANVTGSAVSLAAAEADGLGALADAPSIVQVQGAIDGGVVEVRVRVVGNPAAGIQTVWITYTGLEGPWLGRWQSLDLAQNGLDSTLWEGRLPLEGTPARQVRFIAQAANGFGVVALAENLGRYYTPGGSGLLQPTTLTLEPLAATGGAFGTTASFAAVLRDGAGSPLAGQPVIFGLGPQERLALTDASGRAVATIPLLGLPGRYPVRAAFPSIVDYAGSSTTGAELFEIRRQSSSVSLAPATATGRPGEPGLLTATLLDGAGRRLVEQTVFFVIAGSETYTRAVITNLVGEAPLGALHLSEGDYSVTVHFGGSVTHTGSESAPARLTLRELVPTDDGPDEVMYLPLVSRP